MGCDIHLYVEVRRNGQWESVDKWTKDPDDDRPSIAYGDRYYDDRNYNLFAILGDVRNGSGFAGIRTGDGFVPLAPGRGLPEDISSEVASESESWGSDGHSPSYCTLAELLAYDWTQVTKLCGVVSAIEYWQWSRWDRKNGRGPQHYSGDVMGGRTRIITEADMKARIEALNVDDRNEMRRTIETQLADLYCRVEWTISYYRAAATFWSECMPRLIHLGKPDDVRIVFWFDN